MTPREKAIHESGSIELYPDARWHQWVVTKPMLEQRRDVQLLVLLEDLRTTKDPAVRAEVLERAPALLKKLDIWLDFSTYLEFLRTVAPVDNKLAQSVMRTLVADKVATPPKDHFVTRSKNGVWYPLSRLHLDWRAVELAQIAVVATTVGLAPKSFLKEAAAMLRKSNHPDQTQVGATIVGLHYAGHDTTSLLKWAVKVVENEPEVDLRDRPWRVVVAQSFAFVALFTGDKTAYQTFLRLTNASNAKDPEKIRKLKGARYQSAIRNALYLMWKPYKDLVSARPARFIPSK